MPPIITGIIAGAKAFNWWKWGAVALLGVAVWGHGYETGQQRYLQKALEAAERMDTAEDKAKRLAARISVLEASKGTESIVRAENDGRELQEKLHDATQANLDTGCVSDDQLRIYWEIADRTTRNSER